MPFEKLLRHFGRSRVSAEALLRKLWVVAVFTVAFFAAQATPARAANLTLLDAGNVVSNGIYIGPYTLSADGTAFSAICDSFNAETYFNEWWVATPMSLQQAATNGQFGGTSGSADGYAEIGWLATNMMASVGTPAVVDYQLALWSVFGTGVPTTSGSATLLANAQAWLSQTKQANINPFAQFSNIVIFKPESCLSGCPTWPPQEFVALTTPEPGTLSMIGIGAAALIRARRRRRSVA